MDGQFNSILSIAVIPATVDLIASREGLDDISAINEFYNSRVYELLSKEETKLWHLSPKALYELYSEEKTTGKITYPEEA